MRNERLLRGCVHALIHGMTCTRIAVGATSHALCCICSPAIDGKWTSHATKYERVPTNGTVHMYVQADDTKPFPARHDGLPALVDCPRSTPGRPTRPSARVHTINLVLAHI